MEGKKKGKKRKNENTRKEIDFQTLVTLTMFGLYKHVIVQLKMHIKYIQD